MSELKGYKVCRQRGWEYLKSMKFQLRVSPPEHQELDIRRTRGMEKKARSVRLENQEAAPFKRRRSVVNGRTPDRIEIGFETRMGR
jgi:hypothetical protein